MTELRELPFLIVAKGSHPDETAACVMEAVAYVAGEPWGDHPACASPLCTSFAIGLNDAIASDELRTELLAPLVPKLVGTRDGNDLKRSYLALDWLVRVYVPTWLDLVPALQGRAKELRDLPPILNESGFGKSVRILLSDARKDAAAARGAAWAAAWDAAEVAAGDAARAAVWDAAGDAARDAAGDAAWVAARGAAWDAAGDAARGAAWDAARDAAGDAAWAAARAAAWKKLAPTVEFLQKSAAELLGRMCEVK